MKLAKGIQSGKWSMKLEGVAQSIKGGSLMYSFLQSRKISNNPCYGKQRTKKVA